MAEAKITTALHRLTRGKTTFIVAHKFSTIANADKILLLEEGQLAHQGTHEQLMLESPQYRELYELQFNPDQSTEPMVSEETGNGNNGRIDPKRLDISVE
jgi:ABC-type transport system involved in cytochrome bd biosynthesis fused ATPase/permease subunit